MARLLRRPLPVIPGRWLPQLVFYQDEGTRPLRKRFFDPIQREPHTHAIGLVKPIGGLWTGPLLQATVRGERITIGSSWSVSRRSLRATRPVYELKARDNARVLVIHHLTNLDTLQRRYPLDYPFEGHPIAYRVLKRMGEMVDGRYVDWYAVAKDYDAVWITSNGIEECDKTYEELALWEWSVETVLWLRPAFYVRRRTHRGLSRAEIIDRSEPIDIWAKMQALADHAADTEDEEADERVDA